MLPLHIYRDRYVEWSSLIRPELPTRKVKSADTLEEFPLPGHFDNDHIDEIEITDSGLTFPYFGSYGFFGNFGIAKLLLLDPASSALDQIIKITAFVAAASWHSGCDTSLCLPIPKSSLVHLNAVNEKFFKSDQPLGLHCGHITDFLAWVLHGAGFEARKIGLKNDNAVGHIFLEVFDPESGRWVYMDADRGVYIRIAGEAASADDIVKARAQGSLDKLECINLGRKRVQIAKYNFPHGFSGQIAWKPHFMTERLMLDPENFKQSVIDKGFHSLRKMRYVFERVGEQITARTIDIYLANN